ncbi:DUF4244 domain-containing protein [Pseudonocardia broussonetiae]|uniref:DUF4244 domain-containing protein n=1 Tax=Pseudonocardia broussonetiae TaxID=2736640 RepID=A0A6M6JE65_9PSEU|nr:DUF4244 domain-containing protein [Pseudonocardia broussonetiae]QJY45393.1 DUF4244 domain-containing protein [Pseudonocardia broussonetiae]
MSSPLSTIPTSTPVQRLRLLARHDDGMSTVEYAIGTVAAAAFAAVLYAVVSGESVVTALTDLVTRALSTTF